MRFGILLVVACGLSGCATFVDGPNQYITLNSGSVHYSHCVLSRPGEQLNVTTPGSVRITKSSDDLLVRCSRPGYADAMATIPSDVDLWTFGNLATGGVTALVDAWTGAMYEYPTEFDIPMSVGMIQQSAASAAPHSVPPAAAPVLATPSSGEPARAEPLPGTLPDEP
jgi:hypothetical protein